MDELTAIIKSSEINEDNSLVIKTKFEHFFELTEEWAKKAESLVVTDIRQKKEMKAARTARLALKNIRVGADKTRKDLKAEHLRYNKAVQEVYNIIELRIKPIEEHLQDQEDFRKNLLAKKRKELIEKRKELSAPYLLFIDPAIDLAEISEEDFNDYLETWKVQLEEHEAEQEAIRIEKEKIKEEKKRMAEENRIRKAEELRIETERLEAEALKRKVAAKPDKDKLISNSATIREIEFLEMNTEKGKEIMDLAIAKLDEVCDFILSQSEEL